jgi:hypothetical protein
LQAPEKNTENEMQPDKCHANEWNPDNAVAKVSRLWRERLHIETLRKSAYKRCEAKTM